MVGLALLCVSSLTTAAAPGHEDLSSHQMSVRELMYLDTALALEHTKARLRQQRVGQDIAENAGQIAQSGALKLLAIYGVGKKLLAEVRIGERTHIYMRGQAWAVGMKASPSSYRLQGISGSCVHLKREEEGHTLCLHPGLWGDK